ncbi:hypothetical protein T03_6099 [Trichinella britovi]|uniref:DUF5641 domain-containing protein n=1 Tax=Trichinella britovi TaxID=45882 RepID=A0A0V1C663_TRIBR|nr:hypothetical protein T03_6099 [Trichinella britovi]
MVSRAVHLELVPEMSTVGVLQALRRFMARRGRTAVIQTDNLCSFQFAADEMRRLWQEIDVDQVQRELAGQRIRWKFIRHGPRVEKGAIGRGRALNHPVPSRGLSQRPAADPRMHALSRSGRLGKELAPNWGEVQAMGEKVAVPPAADRQMEASLEKRLLPRRRWTGNTEGPKLNDLVLILEDNLPRGRCPLVVVVELFPGVDCVARSTRF